MCAHSSPRERDRDPAGPRRGGARRRRFLELQLDAEALVQIASVADLDEALAKRPDLAGAEEIREMLLERRTELERQDK